MLTMSLRESIQKAVELKTFNCAFYDRALGLPGLAPVTQEALALVQPKEKDHLPRVQALADDPYVKGPDGDKEVTLEFVLKPIRWEIMPPDTALNVFVRALEHEKRVQEYLSRLSAHVDHLPLQKALQDLADEDEEHRRELHKRFNAIDSGEGHASSVSV